jgi:hypothetical protein
MARQDINEDNRADENLIKNKSSIEVLRMSHLTCLSVSLLPVWLATMALSTRRGETTIPYLLALEARQAKAGAKAI